jgi:hypothetical protein
VELGERATQVTALQHILGESEGEKDYKKVRERES